MFRLPPLPAWEGMHPLLVHMPLGILAIAPLLVVLAMLGGRWARGLSLAAMVVILAGTIGLVLAVSSGEATEKFADGVPGAGAILDQHEEGAELVRNVFFGVSVLAMIVFFVGGRLTGNRPEGTRRPRGAWIGANLLLLAATGAGYLMLANVGHLGGQLVHGVGVRAPIVALPPPAVSEGLPTGGGAERRDRDDD